MNKELSMCISRALSFTKVHLPITRGMAGDQKVVNSFSDAAFMHILLSIHNHNYNEESWIVLV